MALGQAAVSLAHQPATVPEWIVLKGKVLSQRVMAVPSLADLKRCIASTGCHAQAVTVQILKTLIERASENIYSRILNDIEHYFKALELVLAARNSVSIEYKQCLRCRVRGATCLIKFQGQWFAFISSWIDFFR
jgi:hypothetical protein